MGRTSNLACIKKFFALDGGTPVTMEEMKALTKADREELGNLCREELIKREEITE